MSSVRALFAQREARLALAVWVVIPTLFLFFAITLAVDPTTQLDKMRLGVAVLDTGVQTPQGPIIVGTRLVAGLSRQLPVQIVQFPTEQALRDAVLAHDVSGGIVFPADMARNLRASQPVQLQVVKSDANDPFTNLFMANVSNELVTNLNAALPTLLGDQPVPPLVSVVSTPVATTTDFRFGSIPATLVLPGWIATLAFALLLSRAREQARKQMNRESVEMGLVELLTSAGAAALAAAVITLDIALFTWRWDLDLVGLFGLLWLGLVASAWLLQGTMRLVGLEAGAALGLLALFIQQPVSGAAFPPSFAPDVVAWVESVSPLRYLVEGLRNVLIGGSSTPDMIAGLAFLAGAGLVLFGLGLARVAFLPARQHPPQPAPTA